MAQELKPDAPKNKFDWKLGAVFVAIFIPAWLVLEVIEASLFGAKLTDNGAIVAAGVKGGLSAALALLCAKLLGFLK